METVAYEDTLEGRIVAYLDFMFAIACKHLSKYQAAYGLDVQSDAQDLVQEAVRRTLEASNINARKLGATYFRTVIENLCTNFVRDKKNENTKAHNYGVMTSRVERTEQAGYLALREAVRGLSEPQRLAVVERYLGYKVGELTGSHSKSSHAIKLARKNVAAAIN